MAKATKRFVILSGPSCVGKGPLREAVDKFHKEVKYDKIPVIKAKESRGGKPRENERKIWNNPDYFRTAREIIALRGNPQYIVGDCRGFPQAVDLEKVKDSKKVLIFIEIYHTLGAQLKTRRYLKNINVYSIFLSPLSAEEIRYLKVSKVCLPYYLEDLMIHKLIVRARFLGEKFSEAKIADNVMRARDAYSELQDAHNYTHVLVNHDGEGNPNWHIGPTGEFMGKPEGDAKRTLEAFVKILKVGDSPNAEHWTASTI